MKISNEAKIGILATLVLAASVWGYKFLKGEGIIDRSLTLYADFEDVKLLNKTAPVYYRGVDIGVVKDIIFRPDNTSKATLVLNIKQNPGIPKDAIAQLFSAGILAGPAVQLLFDRPCSGDNCAKSGDYLKVSILSAIASMIGTPQELDPYVQKVKTGAISLVDTLNYSLSQPDNEVGKSLRDIKATLQSLRATTAAMNQVMAASANSLTGTMKNAEAITSNLKNNNDKINALLTNANDLTGKANTIDFSKINTATEGVSANLDELKKTLLESQKSLQQLNGVMSKVTNGEGTIGQFATNDTVYQMLNLTLIHTQALMQDLRLNPKRYLNLNPFRSYKTYKVPSSDPLLDTLQLRFNTLKRKN